MINFLRRGPARMVLAMGFGLGTVLLLLALSGSPEPPRWSSVGRLLPGEAQATAPQVLSWADSAVRTNVFSASEVTVDLTFDGAPVVALRVDGGAPMALVDGSNTVSLDATAAHTLQLVKINEASYGLVTFVDISTNGYFAGPPSGSDRRLEIIGDSISNGYGNLGTSAFCSGAANNEDVTQAYGPVAGAALGADVHVTAWSGRGLMRNLDLSTDGVVPQLWTRTVATDATTAWTPQLWVPSAVLINLGTNDFNHGIPDAGAFTAAYTQFLATLRAAYGPQVQIFCVVGPMLSGAKLSAARADVQAVVQQANSAGDALVHFIEFPMQVIDANTGAGGGCDWHPNLATHQAMAAQLQTALQAALGW